MGESSRRSVDLRAPEGHVFGREVAVLRAEKRGEPFVRSLWMGFCLPDRRRHSYDKQLAQILVAHLGDPAQSFLSAA